MPIHPEIPLSAIMELYSKNPILMITRYDLTSNRRIQVAKSSQGSSIIANYVTFAFRGAIIQDIRDEVADVIGRVRPRVLLPKQVEFEKQRAIRVTLDPTVPLETKQENSLFVHSLLDRIEENDLLVSSLNCVLLEESCQAPPPFLVTIPKTSRFGRFTIGLYKVSVGTSHSRSDDPSP
ncbi:MAG: hypothetical protein ACJ8FY_08780 [Gemmataceae bacterium]